MKLLERYLIRTIIETTLVVILILAGLQIFIAFVGELNDIGNGDYNVWQAAVYVLLGLPANIYSFFPMAALLGGLIALGNLASNSELVVMRAAGFSLWQIVAVIVKAALIMTLVALLIGEGISPYSSNLAETRKAIATAGGQTLATMEGVWARDGDHFIHIDTIQPGGQLQGLTIYQFNQQQQLVSATYADSASYTRKWWHLRNVRESLFSNNHVTAQTYPELWLDLAIRPSLLHVADIEPAEMSLWQLNSYIHFEKQNDLHSDKYILAFWNRIFQPIATIVMLLLAIPFILGPLRRATMGLRIMTGIIIGFVFYILNEFAGPFSTVYQIPPIVAAIVPIILFAGIAWWLLRRSY